MDRIRYFADMSIRRGCGFAGIAIGSAMVGMASDARLATRGGAIMVTLAFIVLLAKSLRAPARHYRRTEVWILLDGKVDLPENRVQQAIGQVLRERFLWHAEIAAALAAILWLISFAIALFG